MVRNPGLREAIKTSVRRVLHFKNHDPKVPLREIFTDVAEDVLEFVGFPAKRDTVASLFYFMLDQGELVQLERYRKDRVVRGTRRKRGVGVKSEDESHTDPPPPSVDIVPLYLRSPPPPAPSTIATTLSPAPPPSPPPSSQMLIVPARRPYPPTPICAPVSTNPSTFTSASTIPLHLQRTLLSSLYRACLYSCFAFCKHTLHSDITRNIDDPVASQLGLTMLTDAITTAYNLGHLPPSLIDEEAGFGPGNAFERAGCVVDAVVWKGAIPDRRLLSVLQAGEEIVGALRDEERRERVDMLYRRAERMIREGRGEEDREREREEKKRGEEGEEREEGEETNDEDRGLDFNFFEL